MSMSFRKPANMKYTDLAIYIDAHLPELAKENVNWQVEQNIFEYIYHILFALAYKAGYFNNLDYYDDFAMYGASELFMSMRKKVINAGQVVRGKKVVPIKSSLNYIKSVLYPLKVNYTRQCFHLVINPEVNNQNTAKLEQNLKSVIQQQYSLSQEESYVSAIEEMPQAIVDIINQTPFRDHKAIKQKLYLSVLLTLINQITLPNKLRNKLDKKDEFSDKTVRKYIEAYQSNIEPAIQWHLNEDWDSYIKLLVVKVKKEFSKKVSYYLHCNDLNDEELDNILKSAYSTYENRDIPEGD